MAIQPDIPGVASRQHKQHAIPISTPERARATGLGHTKMRPMAIPAPGRVLQNAPYCPRNPGTGKGEVMTKPKRRTSHGARFLQETYSSRALPLKKVHAARLHVV